MKTILVVEDDELLNDGISFTLKKEGYTIFSAFNGKESLQIKEKNKIDLIILDINLPDKNGFEVCEDIHKISKIPVIFLTARDTENDVLKGFKLGCDDYITKPFSLPILKERVRAVLRRSENAAQENVYRFKEIAVDFNKKAVFKNRNNIKLTPTEYKLVKLFIDNKGKVLTRGNILERLWDIDGNFVDENTVYVNIRRLRIKIEDKPSDPQYIKTVFGIGYTWGDE